MYKQLPTTPQLEVPKVYKQLPTSSRCISLHCTSSSQYHPKCKPLLCTSSSVHCVQANRVTRESAPGRKGPAGGHWGGSSGMPRTRWESLAWVLGCARGSARGHRGWILGVAEVPQEFTGVGPWGCPWTRWGSPGWSLGCSGPARSYLGGSSELPVDLFGVTGVGPPGARGPAGSHRDRKSVV